MINKVDDWREVSGQTITTVCVDEFNFGRCRAGTLSVSDLTSLRFSLVSSMGRRRDWGGETSLNA